MLTFLLATLLPFLTLEHATTPAEQQWGLMGRTELPEDHGMLFHYTHSARYSIWMFNCYVDLDVAFLNQHGRILEIRKLEAHPDWMDSTYPIETVDDLDRYPATHPLVKRFKEEAVTASYPTRYVLEMPAGWFAAHAVQVGDQLQWNSRYPNASFQRLARASE